MKVLLGISTFADIVDPKMGSERQAMGTAHALGELGHEVHVTNILKGAPDWEQGFDVVHLFNASGKKGPYMQVMDMAQILGKPVVLTPVYWPLQELLYQIAKQRNFDPGERPELFQAFREDIDGLRVLVQNADWVAPNAELEMATLLGLCDQTYTFDRPPLNARCTIVPNAVDVAGEIEKAMELDNPLPPDMANKLGERFVICVARMEIRKNQHRLIEAMEHLWASDPQLQLVLLGAINQDYVKTWENAIKGKNVIIVQPSSAANVLNLMKRAVASVLPSLLETPGLVNLEAAAMGVPVVCSNRGSVKEYMGDGAYYCDPLDSVSIANAIRAAIDGGRNESLMKHVRTQFSYEKVAEMTERIYLHLLEGGEA